MNFFDPDFPDRLYAAADEAHRQLVLRIATYFDLHIRPTLIGVPDEEIIRMRAKYIVEVRKNPDALRYFTKEGECPAELCTSCAPSPAGTDGMQPTTATGT